MTSDGSVLLVVGEAISPEVAAGLQERGIRLVQVAGADELAEVEGVVSGCVFAACGPADPFLTLARLKRSFPEAVVLCTPDSALHDWHTEREIDAAYHAHFSEEPLTYCTGDLAGLFLDDVEKQLSQPAVGEITQMLRPMLGGANPPAEAKSILGKLARIINQTGLDGVIAVHDAGKVINRASIPVTLSAPHVYVRVVHGRHFYTKVNAVVAFHHSPLSPLLDLCMSMRNDTLVSRRTKSAVSIAERSWRTSVRCRCPKQQSAYSAKRKNDCSLIITPHPLNWLQYLIRPLDIGTDSIYCTLSEQPIRRPCISCQCFLDHQP